MIGHQQIIKARSRRRRPSAIFFDFNMRLPNVRYRWQEAERALENGLFPVVTIEPEKVHMPRDLRFVTGCHIHASSPTWSAEFIAFGEELAAAGATQITMNAFAESDEILTYKNGKWEGVNARRFAA